MIRYILTLLTCTASMPCSAAAPSDTSPSAATEYSNILGGPPTAELFYQGKFYVDPATGLIKKIPRDKHTWTDAIALAAANAPASTEEKPASSPDLPDVKHKPTRDPKTLAKMPLKESIAQFCTSQAQTPSLQNRRGMRIAELTIQRRRLTFVQRLPNPLTYLEKYAITLEKSRATLARAAATIAAAKQALKRTELDVRYAYTLKQSQKSIARANKTLRECNEFLQRQADPAYSSREVNATCSIL